MLRNILVINETNKYFFVIVFILSEIFKKNDRKRGLRLFNKKLKITVINYIFLN